MRLHGTLPLKRMPKTENVILAVTALDAPPHNANHVQIGHFRVAVNRIIKARLSVKLFMRRLILFANE